MNTSTNNQNLRELAYRIWEAEGRPIGQAERHWQMALEQARSEQDSYTTGEDFLGTTGESFLGKEITPDGETNVLQDEREYALQNNPFEDEAAQTTFAADSMDTPQQPADTQMPAKSGGKRKSAKSTKSTKSRANDTLARQDTNAGGRSKPGNRKASDNILV